MLAGFRLEQTNDRGTRAALFPCTEWAVPDRIRPAAPVAGRPRAHGAQVQQRTAYRTRPTAAGDDRVPAQRRIPVDTAGELGKRVPADGPVRAADGEAAPA